MKITVQSFFGSGANSFLQDLARLRIEVFRSFPYLYDGTLHSEQAYLKSFMEASDSVFVVAFDREKVVGVSTGIPLGAEPLEVQKPWRESGLDINKVYYFSESVLQEDYRGYGIGVRFFEEREKWARRLQCNLATFCAVERPDDHPRKPSGYIPLDHFWINRGFRKKEGYTCTMSWKEIDSEQERMNKLQFWYKHL